MMLFTKYSLIFVMILVMVCNINLYAETPFKEINCGVISVGQSEYISIPIVNEGNVPLVIERVSVCCGNPKPTINMMTIPAGNTVELIQEVKRTKPGPFEIAIRVYIKEPEDKTLSFNIKGEAEQHVSALMGWSGTPLKKVDYHKDNIRLDRIDHNGKDLVLRLSAEPNFFNLENSLLSIKSRYFSLDTSSLEYRRNENAVFQQLLNEEEHPPIDTQSPAKKVSERLICKRVGTHLKSCDKFINTLNLCLKSNSPLPIGELSDNIVLVFKEGSECHIPIIFRSVGSIYGEYSSIGVGKIPLSGTLSKTFKIHFNNGVKPWTQIKWEAKGKLSEVIDIFPNEEKILENTLSLTIAVHGDHLSPAKKGFMSSYVDFFGNEQDDNKVRLLLYGYR